MKKRLYLNKNESKKQEHQQFSFPSVWKPQENIKSTSKYGRLIPIYYKRSPSYSY